MHDLTCLIKSCQARVYVPAGTHSICREHFLNYLTWRRRKGPQMFMKYAGMTMEERDPPSRRVGQHHPRRRSPNRLSAENLTSHASHKQTILAPSSCRTVTMTGRLPPATPQANDPCRSWG